MMFFPTYTAALGRLVASRVTCIMREDHQAEGKHAPDHPQVSEIIQSILNFAKSFLRVIVLYSS